jgi:hypothetical protein
MNRISRSALVLASAIVCMPAFALYPQVDFEWYANVGKPMVIDDAFPAPRPGMIWSPAHTENTATGPVMVAAQWIKDDYEEQVALHSTGALAAR